jgi:hypothetical protein
MKGLIVIAALPKVFTFHTKKPTRIKKGITKSSTEVRQKIVASVPYEPVAR